MESNNREGKNLFSVQDILQIDFKFPLALLNGGIAAFGLGKDTNALVLPILTLYISGLFHYYLRIRG